MSNFRNEPHMNGVDGEGKVKRYSHTPIAIEHDDIHASIQANGHIVLTKVASVKGEDVEFDEIEIPASLVFKLAFLLKTTRKIEYVNLNAQHSHSAPSAREDKV